MSDTFFQHLVFDEVVANARKAFAEGRLQFQQEDLQKNFAGCVYDLTPQGFPGCGCAIGVSMKPGIEEHLADLEYELDDTDIQTLINHGVVTADDPEQLGWMQALHDDCCTLNFLNRSHHIEKFKEFIGV